MSTPAPTDPPVTTAMILSWVTLGVTVAIFATGKVRIDVVAVCAMLFLFFAGVLTMHEALAGFGDSLVIMIASTFVLGRAITKTGLGELLAAALNRWTGGRPPLVVAAVMVTTMLLSAFMSSTGTVCIMMPIAIGFARRANMSPSKVLIPVSYGAAMGSYLTLISTPPNMVASDTLLQHGYEPFQFFSFAPFGLPMCFLSVLFVSVVGIRILPDRVPVEVRLEFSSEDLQRMAKKKEPKKSRWEQLLERLRLKKKQEDPEALSESQEAKVPTPIDNAPLGEELVEIKPIADEEKEHEKSERSSLKPTASVTLEGENASLSSEQGGQRASTDRRPNPRRLSALPNGPAQALCRLTITESSRLVGKSVSEVEMRSKHHVNLAAVEQTNLLGNRHVKLGHPDTVMHAGDILYVYAEPKALEPFILFFGGLEMEATESIPAPAALAEFVVPDTSSLLGKTVREVHFDETYGANIVALYRSGKKLIAAELAGTQFTTGDSLLLVGHEKKLQALFFAQQLASFKDLALVASFPDGAVGPSQTFTLRLLDQWRLVVNILIIVAMITIMTINIFPSAMVMITAAALLIVSRCVTAEESYNAVNWECVVMTAAVLSLVKALTKTGAIDLAANGIARLDAAPLTMMIIVFLVTTFFTQFMSNTASGVLVSPIAFNLAIKFNTNPHAFLMTTALAASASFLTPMSTPVNTLVYSPGKYTFWDFFKIGVVLLIIDFVITIALVPVVYKL